MAIMLGGPAAAQPSCGVGHPVFRQEGTPMRLMHLADLHIGKRVNEFPMLDDQRYTLEKILCMVEEVP